VTPEQWSAFALTVYSSLTATFIVPLMILIGIGGVTWSLLRKAQSKGLAIEQMFTDEAGKASAGRVIAFGAFGVSSWYLAVGRLSGNPNPSEFDAYLLTWGVAFVGNKALDTWAAIRGKAAPAQEPAPPG
jgi:hypothetical protein